MNTEISRRYSELYEQAMLIERRMCIMDDTKRQIQQKILDEINEDIKKIENKIMSL